MYSTGLIQHEGRIFSPDGSVTPGNSDILACGHPRPTVEPGAFSIPWGIVHTSEGPQEYCIECCEALEVEAVKQLPPGAAYSAYYEKIDDKGYKRYVITTWHGTVLMRAYDWRTYYHNFGGRFISISAVDPQGNYWHGRASYDNGECITMHKSKAK